MNIFDIGIILLFILFIIIGFKNGVMREIVSFLGIIVVFIVSYMFKGIVGNFLCEMLPFIKFTGVLKGMTAINILLYQAISFFIIFSILLGIYAVAMKLSKVLQKIINLTIILWLPSKLLGALVSLIKGYLILFVVFIMLMIPLQNSEEYTNSKMIKTILYETPILSTCTKSLTSSMKEVYDLVTQVSEKNISTNDANLKVLDILLKYKVTTKENINILINKNKLTDIQNIESVLNKY